MKILEVDYSKFIIETPALISFSGGRTSGFLLYCILQAFNGKLPDDIIITFANTGKEFPQTLDFVEKCSREWNIKIHWLEWQRQKPYFTIVDHKTASRGGEPFHLLNSAKQSLPNPFVRFCTSSLKIKPMERFMLSLGYKTWDMVIGLRYDEPRRTAKRLDPNNHNDLWDTVMPFYTNQITEKHVTNFWNNNTFDLQLKPYQSNCDLCFLKGSKIKLRILEENPQLAEWWINQENRFLYTIKKGKNAGNKEYADFMRNGMSYAKLLEISQSQDSLFDLLDDSNVDCYCTD